MSSFMDYNKKKKYITFDNRYTINVYGYNFYTLYHFFLINPEGRFS